MINCAVTVMPVKDKKIGFLRRDKSDTYGGKLVAPGGKIEMTDGNILDGVMYDSVEECARREMIEETGFEIDIKRLEYFCSLTLPNGRVVISLWYRLEKEENIETLEFYTKEEIAERDDFAPGMKEEALMLYERI